MGTSVKAPPERNYGQETRETLQAQIDLAPQLYRAEAQYSPQYADLERENYRRLLFGGGGGGLVGDVSRAEQDQRAADITSVEQLGQRATQAFRAANPQQQVLMDLLNSQALQDLQNVLNPHELRQAQQATRGRISPGLVHGPSAAFQEALQVNAYDEDRRRRSQAFGGQVAALNAGTAQDPFLAVLGRGSQTPGLAQGLLGSSGPGLFNPESQYAGDIRNQAYQGTLARNTASAANRTALIGAGISAAGSVGSSL